MSVTRFLVTGGAGFIGAALCLALRRSFANAEITALDNLSRRGSEANLATLAALGVRFCHGDVRCEEDWRALPDAELVIEAAADPSVQSGLGESPARLWRQNLGGVAHALEYCRERGAALLFLSSSRVSPIRRLNDLPFDERETRFVWREGAVCPGFSARGIAEDFPLDGARSFYGASKLAAELLIGEYAATSVPLDHYRAVAPGPALRQSSPRSAVSQNPPARSIGEYAATSVPALINRVGVVAGPGQFGKSDQGIVSYWAMAHHFERPLCYTGFGGLGKQVRDVLHVEDLCALVLLQIARPELWRGAVYQVGGGVERSVSLLELTDLCRRFTGKSPPISAQASTSPVDVRIIITDAARVEPDFAWKPRHDLAATVEDTCRWVRDHESALAALAR